MSTPRAALLLVAAAIAASCWDGTLDPITGGPGASDADSDSDADSETETGSDSETAPAGCAVNVTVVVNFWDYFVDDCDFHYTGVCAAATAGCAGCAWSSGVEGDCGEDGICCIEEDVLGHCVTWWDLDFYCGYQAGECEAEPDYGEGVEEPVCPDGTFCCFSL